MQTAGFGNSDTDVHNIRMAVSQWESLDECGETPMMSRVEETPMMSCVEPAKRLDAIMAESRARNAVDSALWRLQPHAARQVLIVEWQVEHPTPTVSGDWTKAARHR